MPAVQGVHSLPPRLNMGGALSFLRHVYDLDTLDTRFTVSSSTPYTAAIEARIDAAAEGSERAARWSGRPSSESRWRTPEFYLYYVLFTVAMPCMFWIAYDASKRTI